MQIKGIFKPPPFGADALDQIEQRLIALPQEISVIDGRYLCTAIKKGMINPDILHDIRLRARKVTDQALKTDLFRLLAEAKKLGKHGRTQPQHAPRR